MPTAVDMCLSAAQRHRLKKLTRSPTMAYQLVVRARIVRLAAAGQADQHAARLARNSSTACATSFNHSAAGMSGVGAASPVSSPRTAESSWRT